MIISTQRLLLNICVVGILTILVGLIPAMSWTVQAQDSDENRRATVHAMTFTQLQDKFYKVEIDKEISLNIQNLTLEQALREIARETGLRLSYRGDIMVGEKTVSLQENSISVSEALTTVLENTGLDYKFSQNGYLLITEAEELMEEQIFQDTVRGTVVDARTGEALPGVNIVVEGTTTGTTTNLDGEFELSVPSLDLSLVFTYIGYERLEISIDNREEINIELNPDVQLLDDLVVVGYGTQERAHLTGSVEQVSTRQLENRAATNVSQMLQGASPGLNFSMPSAGFEPGAELDIQIRGAGSITGSPSAHVIIDGIPGDLNSLNPRDIESISVLKDAAASAIIGSRAPFGVIMVTTKQGTSDRTTVNYNGHFSIAQTIRLPDMVDSYTFARAMNEAGVNAGGRIFDNETIDRIIAHQEDPSAPAIIPDPNNPNRWGDRHLQSGNNNWLDIIFGEAIRSQHNLSVSGGVSDDIRYYLSAGHVNEDGVINYADNYFKRNNLTARVDANVSEWVDIRFNSRFTDSERLRPFRHHDNPHGVLFNQVSRSWPNLAYQTPLGEYHRRTGIPSLRDAGDNLRNVREYVNTIATVIQPFESLAINADFSYRTRSINMFETFLTAYTTEPDGTQSAVSGTTPNSVRENEGIEKYYTGNIYSTYNFNLNQTHNFVFLLGYQFERFNNRNIMGQQFDLVTQSVPSFSTATGTILLDDTKGHWATEGVFSRFNYNYRERYLFEANARYDGTSNFASGNRYGLFPSVSLGWNIDRERFWEPIRNILNEFRLRASWGQLGNHNVSPYQDLPLMGIQSNLSWLLHGVRPVYTSAPNLVSPDLTWETAETYNFGLDVGIFNDKIMASFELYQRTTRNMLGPSEALPATLGASIPQQNNATMRTRGWETSLQWRDIVSDNFDYRVIFVLSDYKDVVTEFHNPLNSLTTFYEGMHLGEIWGFVTEGLFQSQGEIESHADQSFLHGEWYPGDVKYKDLNGNGVINIGENTVDNPGDRRIIGNSTPRYQFGLNLIANYRNFEFSTFWQGTGKRDFAFGPNENYFWGFRTAPQVSLFTFHMDYYRDREDSRYEGLGINTDAYYPRPYQDQSHSTKNQQVQTRYLQNGAYLRLKNAQIRFSLPVRYTQRIGITQMSFYTTGENLLTFTSLPKSFDPETAYVGDYGAGKTHFPQRSIAFGIDIQF